MALTECYVDYTSGNDGTGDGTSWANAYKTTQGALDNFTPGAGGTRINIRAGESNKDVLTQRLDLDDWEVPTESHPLILEGCTSVPDDGGIGVIDGDGSYGLFEGFGGVNDSEYIIVKNMKIQNTGSAHPAFYFDAGCIMINVEVTGNTNTYCVHSYSSLDMWGCNINDCSGRVYIQSGSGADIFFNYFANGDTNSFGCALDSRATGTIQGNIFALSGSSDALEIDSDAINVRGNAFFTTGSGKAIHWDDTTPDRCSIINNLFEGWGTGIDWASATNPQLMFAYNSFYNCTNNEANGGSTPIIFEELNETLSASPFAKQGPRTYANRYNWFRPVDVGSVLKGAWPYAS